MAKNFKKTATFVYAVLAVLLVLCIGIQFYWAGMAVFADGTYWSTHVMFVHAFGFTLPFIMLLAAIAAVSTRFVYWHLFLLFLLTFLMYFSANMGAAASWVGAMHPMIGTMLLAVASSNVWHAVRAYRHDGAKHNEDISKKLQGKRLK